MSDQDRYKAQWEQNWSRDDDTDPGRAPQQASVSIHPEVVGVDMLEAVLQPQGGALPKFDLTLHDCRITSAGEIQTFWNGDQLTLMIAFNSATFTPNGGKAL